MEISGDVAINIVFNEDGYNGTPLQVLNPSTTGVYPTTNGIKHVISGPGGGPITIPANGVVSFESTSTLRLNVTENNEGWGFPGSSSGTNVGMNVFINGFVGDEGCLSNTKKPVVEVRLRAMVP